MPKRKRASTGARGARSRRPPRRPVPTARRVSPRRRPEQSTTVSARRTVRRVSRHAVSTRLPESPRKRGDGLSDFRSGRTSLHARRRARTGLPAPVLSLRRRNENASSKKTTRSVCSRKRAARRAVIISTGYGGRNGATNYRKEDKKCRA